MTDEATRDETTTRESSSGTAWRWIRWALAVAAICAVITVIASRYRECSETTTTAANGDISTVIACAPPSLTSASLILLLLLVGLLLWPDLTELTVGGVTLKRKVAEAAQKATDAKEKAESLATTIQILQARIDTFAFSNASASNNIYFGREWTPTESERIQRQAAEAGEFGAEAQSGRGPLENMSDDKLQTTVIREWESLSGRLDLRPSRLRENDPLDAEVRQRTRSLQRAFIADFEPQIRTVRDLRNAVAHGQQIPREDLVNGLVLLNALNRRAEVWLEGGSVEPL
ncbi:hypothetical protein [Agromyces cerinus]|uniref:hypothetical protein n=1 Tax=Agromyces cerinus TaxID=33878 RepID=UPI0013566E4B|nr:hypothetical protein [Agromyces cerinus]